MRTIAPGESLVYRFTAERAGIWMYHCSTMPMSAHIANGLFGAVVIEPPGLPAVDRSYVLVQPRPASPPGERVRLWVLDAGPNRSSSFHVVGGRFDAVYAEGAYLLRGGTGGAQLLGLTPAQGGFVGLTFPEAGRYPFVSHVMVDAERGAHGLVEVTG